MLFDSLVNLKCLFDLLPLGTLVHVEQDKLSGILTAVSVKDKNSITHISMFPYKYPKGSILTSKLIETNRVKLAMAIEKGNGRYVSIMPKRFGRVKLYVFTGNGTVAYKCTLNMYSFLLPLRLI